MTLLAIPNVSEGRDADNLRTFADSVEAVGARVLDIHSDEAHNRSVFTITGEHSDLVEAVAALAVAAKSLDLRRHIGVHPRLGALDVCPFVPHDDSLEEAVAAARVAGRVISERAGLPVYFYGAAALRRQTRELPSLRRGGLPGLIARAKRDLAPDLGPRVVDPRWGVVCVGARKPLIAFNVYIESDEETAKRIAAAVRSAGGGPPGIRAMGWLLAPPARAQVSMNLIDPEAAGIEAALEAVTHAASQHGVAVLATEIVGLVPERFLPDPDAKAARLLITPGRSIESALGS